MTGTIVLALSGLLWASLGMLEMRNHNRWWQKAFPMAHWKAHYVPDNWNTIVGYLFGPIGLAIGSYERRNTRMH